MPHNSYPKAFSFTAILFSLCWPTVAMADSVVGKVFAIDGHLTPTCRRVIIKRQDTGAFEYYRIPDTGSDNSIMAVGLTAVATRDTVELGYTTGVTTGCGTEPRINYLAVQAN